MPDFGKYKIEKKQLKKNKLFFVLLFLSLGLSISLWFRNERRGEFKKEVIFKILPEEIFQINTRRSYYKNKFLGKILENKITLYFYKYQKNFFQGLDINYYFFANHPRERAGVKEYEKFPWVCLPVFLIGLFWQIKKKMFLLLFYFFSCLAIFSFFNLDRFSYLLFPFFVICFFFGFEKIFIKLLRNDKES